LFLRLERGAHEGIAARLEALDAELEKAADAEVKP
jgi:hypothetical protein